MAGIWRRVLSSGMTPKERATATFEVVEDELREISRWLYENPEIAYEEYESSQRMARFLESHGFSVTYPAYGIATAFEATVGTSGPRVVICCEYDALPAVGHACGHNIIATAAAGAGVALAGLVEELGIRVNVLGTPAEEAGGGKVDLINAGALKDTAAAMMVHPEGRSNTVDPAFLAIQAYQVEFHGKPAHASGSPELGINALDAVIQSYNSISTLRQHLLPSDRVHGIITHGGEVANVIPAYTRSEWMIRATTEERLTEIITKVMACFEASATATGCTLEVQPDGHPFAEMLSNLTMVGLFKQNAAALGRTMVHFDTLKDQSTGSSDMGNISQLVPSIHPSLFVDAGGADNHQPEFAAATITPSGEQALRDGAIGMAHTIIDLAEQDLWSSL